MTGYLVSFLINWNVRHYFLRYLLQRASTCCKIRGFSNRREGASV
uniref:Photosystem II protein T n=1 Tax=Hyalogonium fusiforme TaxID=2926373 RepID=A0A9E8AFY2_9CHLO|nr:photosystem II protein T [Hyalogonium fusiforme]